VPSSKQTGPLQVRAAVPEDARRFAEIHVAAWKVAYKGLIEQETIDALSIEEKVISWLKVLTSPNPGTRITVCELNGVVVAWSTHGPCRDGNDRLRLGEVAEGEIHGLYAHPDAWGVGAGAALLSDALEYLDRLWPSSVVWVLTKNSRARLCYERAGFKVVKEHVYFERHPEATTTMLRRQREA
jgi:ribosomal protein S18 acetylase RimI-like enzyme